MQFSFRASMALTLICCGNLAVAQSQALTPGAAAIGGTTTSTQLIGPGGSLVPIRAAPNAEDNSQTSTQITTGESSLRSSDQSEPVVLPADRTQEATATETSEQTSAPEKIEEPKTVETSIPQPPENAETSQITAGATPTTAPAAEDDEAGALNPINTFEPARLDFGNEGIALTAQHEIALDPIAALMRANPLMPLQIIAVLPLSEATSDEAKQKARRRILAVRSNLISRGLSADNLTFVISANTESEPFANFILIER